jgi:hypothetical protein
MVSQVPGRKGGEDDVEPTGFALHHFLASITASATFGHSE